MTMSALLSPNTTFCFGPRVAMVNLLRMLSLSMNAQGIFSSMSIRIWYAPWLVRYTSKLADGQGKYPTLEPCHEGFMLLSTVIVNSGSFSSLVTNGSRFGMVASISTSVVVISKRCSATLNLVFPILFFLWLSCIYIHVSMQLFFL